MNEEKKNELTIGSIDMMSHIINRTDQVKK
jgi:hypothetical protein